MDKAKTILMCDDDEGIIDVARLVLEGKGYNVVSVKNGEKVLNKALEVNPDIILLDLWMPYIGGEELCAKLKAELKTAHIPIIIISASRNTDKVATKAGADDYLCKPFEITDLEAIVDKHLQN